jgi:hypothetical protein
MPAGYTRALLNLLARMLVCVSGGRIAECCAIGV